jgi:hypothetical protein
MSFYSIALFLHIVGALLLFGLLTGEGIFLRQGGLVGARFNRVVGPISGLLILFPGLYMTASTWGSKGWILVGLTGWVVIAVVGTFTGVMLLRGRMSAGTAAVSWTARVGLALGIVFVMTTKPDLLGSAVAVVVGAAIGLAAGLMSARRLQAA